MRTRPNRRASRSWSPETVALVLRHHFRVSDDRFNAMDLDAFAKRQRDAGLTQGTVWNPWQLLLVCKAWRAVGEPILYETVVVRSLAQAHTLMDAFRANPTLGGYVRRLRMEGAYGVAGSQIIHFVAATVSDLWLNVIGVSSDMVLIKPQGTALSWLNPRTVTIFNRRDDLHEISYTMRKFLAKAIPHWSHLRHVTYSFEEGLDKVHGLYDAVGKSTVESIEVPLDSWGPFRTSLDKVLLAPNLRKLICHKALSEDIVSILATTAVTVEHRLQLASSDVPFSRQFPAEMLDMVLGFAVLATEPRAQPWFDRETARQLLTVSSQVKDFTLAHICRRPCFRSATELAKFNTMLVSRPDLAQRLVAVDLAFAPPAPNPRHGYYSPHSPNDVAGAIALNFLATRAPNLRVVKTLPSLSTSLDNLEGLLPLPQWAVDIVARLQDLEVLDGVTLGTEQEVVTSVTLARMTKLRRLVNTSWPRPPLLQDVAPMSGVFSELRELEIRYSSLNNLQSSDIWPVLTEMDLPMLTYFGYHTIELHKSMAFFKKHGAKLNRLAFRIYSNTEEELSLASWCSNVTQVEVWDPTITDMDVLPSVLRLTLNVPELAKFKKTLSYTLKEDLAEPGKPCPLPNLREVLNQRLPDWKNVEWQNFSDELREKGTLLLNRDEHAWRPRLRHPDVDDDETETTRRTTFSDYRRARTAALHYIDAANDYHDDVVDDYSEDEDDFSENDYFGY
ncbi:hypothetical protein EXIGLDRAFT_731872 [Exidia glandulosa HHB12029]|uniref:Uncharacterized protein n=1 Tax=Exidia glandulosa HHB12029 TaxID=1314781 RepID=A0A165KY18_EXIGL|nr:hypothetical protein EXIGLDRAFT_731872 [Exidia glandulosa HHB12029]